MIRLFVGLALPAELAARLESLGGGVPGARWVAGRNLHLTLRFAGEVDEDVAEDLHHRLGGLRAPVFDIRLRGFGTFGGRKPRALWVGAEPNPALDALQSRIERLAQAAGLEPETRNFTPHVTLAWLKDAPADRIAAFMRHHSPFAASFTVDHVCLYQSHLHAQGAEYQVLAEYALDSK
ncbi:RNA 2',3'-cyclic phosphodiesterase [Magnetospirillum sp. 64-120]|uniref:RNA 2',3'-cyclic phosphodiesterase n=1 Tax=Magnetospirillum sp. 64-120 TaxID=1895778 RepID=UPI000926A282|nr:RNA 2',3'-cyclic phosphodiesterase [Magnetospirillum sp. 64-120]OJX81785.1 MAG: 2'-5' RNA ligase [Magnetospirillum sp. 64-120]